jgi:hypothetical protein
MRRDQPQQPRALPALPWESIAPPTTAARRVAAHARFWRPQECLSLISAADMDSKEAAAAKVRQRQAGNAVPACLTLRLLICSCLPWPWIVPVQRAVLWSQAALCSQHVLLLAFTVQAAAAYGAPKSVDAEVRDRYLSPSFKFRCTRAGSWRVGGQGPGRAGSRLFPLLGDERLEWCCKASPLLP